jgi:transcriptional antiterminator RfaH
VNLYYCGRMRTKGNNTQLRINHLEEENAKWFALKTKFKAEKLVVQHLKSKGIQAYIPLLKETKRYTRKIKTVVKPLLNCYVFVHIDKSQYVPVLETEYVLGFVKQGHHIISIPNEEIDLLKKIVGEIEEVHAAGMDYSEGQMVEIVAGNLTGLRGKLVKKKSKHHFIVALDYIGIQLEMEVDKALLQKVGSLAAQS